MWRGLQWQPVWLDKDHWCLSGPSVYCNLSPLLQGAFKEVTAEGKLDGKQFFPLWTSPHTHTHPLTTLSDSICSVPFIPWSGGYDSIVYMKQEIWRCVGNVLFGTCKASKHPNLWSNIMSKCPSVTGPASKMLQYEWWIKVPPLPFTSLRQILERWSLKLMSW